jgi:hypothetical protein
MEYGTVCMKKLCPKLRYFASSIASRFLEAVLYGGSRLPSEASLEGDRCNWDNLLGDLNQVHRTLNRELSQIVLR